MDRIKDFSDQSSLAAPSLADDRHHSALACSGAFNRGDERAVLPGPTYEGCVTSEPQIGSGLFDPADLPNQLPLFATPHIKVIDCVEKNRGRCQGCGGVAHVGGTRRGHRFKPRRHVHDVSHHGVAVGSAHPSEEDFAGVYSDPQLDRPSQLCMLSDKCCQ